MPKEFRGSIDPDTIKTAFPSLDQDQGETIDDLRLRILGQVNRKYGSKTVQVAFRIAPKDRDMIAREAAHFNMSQGDFLVAAAKCVSNARQRASKKPRNRAAL